jgi:hypothetical protein
MSKDFQHPVVSWDLPYPIRAQRPVNDYSLLQAVSAVFCVAGYRHRMMVEMIDDAVEPWRDEAMPTTCQSFNEDMPLEQAKIQIKAYFESRHGEVLDYVDIGEALCIPLPTIVEACEELEREGRIAGVN